MLTEKISYDYYLNIKIIFATAPVPRLSTWSKVRVADVAGTYTRPLCSPRTPFYLLLA